MEGTGEQEREGVAEGGILQGKELRVKTNAIIWISSSVPYITNAALSARAERRKDPSNRKRGGRDGS